MSRPYLCDACGLHDSSQSVVRVHGIRIVIGVDRSQQTQEIFDGDLCSACSTELLATYLKVGDATQLEVPAFLRETAA